MIRQKIADSQRTWLLTQLTEWQTEGLLSSDQADRILMRYETDEEVGRRKQSQLVLALLGMAAFLFGLAVLLVVAFNWEAIPRGGKLAIILTAVAVTHVVGFCLRPRAPRLAEVVFFLGCMVYGAGIGLVAQVLHLDSHYPNGVWLWAVGVLPFALCLDSLLCHLLFASLMALWAGMEVLGASYPDPWLQLDSWHLPHGAYSLPFLALPGLVWAYRKALPSAVGLYVALLTWWVSLQAFAWGAEARSVFWIGSVGAILLILAEAHRSGNVMAIPYRLWGVLLSAGSLIALSSFSFWEHEVGRRMSSPYYTARSPMVTAITEAIAILMLLGIALGLLLLVKKRDRDQAHELLRKQWFPAGLAVCMAALAFWSLAVSDTAATWVLPTVLANLAMLGLALYLIRVGVREERSQPFAAGILYFLVWAFARYIDLFSDAGGMLGAAALFFLCGAGLIIVARFWSRARLVQQKKGALVAAPAPFVGPAWIDGPARWVASHTQPILIATAVLQVLLLVGMIVVRSAS